VGEECGLFSKKSRIVPRGTLETAIVYGRWRPALAQVTEKERTARKQAGRPLADLGFVVLA